MTQIRREASSQKAVSLTNALLRLSRPHQWIKNSVVLAGLVFAEVSDQPRAVANALLAVLAFILASVAIYVSNDIHDAVADREHPTKRWRPIAAGAVSPVVAAWFGVVVALASVLVAAAVSWEFLGIVGIYLVMMGLYNQALKQIPVLDVVIIALGFVFRAMGGAVAVDTPISPWLLVCAFLLALFLGFGKRRAEFMLLGDGAGMHRRSLEGYTLPLLDQLLRVSAGSALVTYAVYTFDASSVPDSNIMVVTVPLVAFAIFRYMYLIYGKNLGGSPESLLYRDRWILASVVAWAVLALILMEFGS